MKFGGSVNRRRKIDAMSERTGGLRNASRFESGEGELMKREAVIVRVKLQPMSDLDLMIANGWGDVPQSELPENWREVGRS